MRDAIPLFPMCSVYKLLVGSSCTRLLLADTDVEMKVSECICLGFRLTKNSWATMAPFKKTEASNVKATFSTWLPRLEYAQAHLTLLSMRSAMQMVERWRTAV